MKYPVKKVNPTPWTSLTENKLKFLLFKHLAQLSLLQKCPKFYHQWQKQQRSTLILLSWCFRNCAMTHWFIYTFLFLFLFLRYAVVTGANKGIGFEICRKLASNGIVVVLTGRDEKKGLEAVEKLREFGLSDHVVFHQLDVADPASIASFADFIKTKYGKLDILVRLKMLLVV